MKDNRAYLSWEAFKEQEFVTPAFLINPYIPADGIVFLWGETSTGKSPLGWHLAAAIGRGDNFFGLPATKGKVLYLEVDTPPRLVHKRISGLDTAPNVDFLFLPPLSVPNPAPADAALLQRAADVEYDLVIVNTLRKVHDLDDKDATTPKIVYSYFQHMFPGTALVFVHHTKKVVIDSRGTRIGRDKESFSGSNAWLNDAQVGLYLQRYEHEKHHINLRLHHEKSQVSELLGPMGLFLDPVDGVTMHCPKFEQLMQVYELLNSEPDTKPVALDEKIGAMFNCSRQYASRLRHQVIDGEFPGTKWLGMKDRSEDSAT